MFDVVEGPKVEGVPVSVVASACHGTWDMGCPACCECNLYISMKL